ncbi:winged helix-turn-helix domain-containing protein [Collinsella tanakaei]|nr:winged helix-turn-helix domain-containing protein [Collinsella tanakaei]
MKLCNLLYLLARDATPDKSGLQRIAFSQEELAEILLLNRVSVARLLAQLREEGAIDTRRGAITIIDEDRLLSHCSLEVRQGWALGVQGREMANTHKDMRHGGGKRFDDRLRIFSTFN